MKLFGREVNLATSKPKDINQEIGVGGTGQLYFKGESTRASGTPKTKDYRDMLDNDGTVQSLYNILTYPILGNTYRIENDEEDVEAIDDETEAHPQADFINDCFTLPPHKGGMSTPFSLVMGQMLGSILDGYRAFELVYMLNEQGRIVLRKIALRDNDTLDILRDDRGGFDGLEQTAFVGRQHKTITIDKDKVFLFTFGKDHNALEGRSAFRASYYHYDKKHRLYYLYNQAAQVSAMGIKKGTAPTGASPADRDANLAAIDQLSVRPTIMMPDGWELEVQDLSTKFDIMKGIDHHNAEMARSVLAQFLMLGTASGDTGSFALSKSHSDIFVMALQGLMLNIEEHINSYLIPKLIDYNFEKPLYPTFRFNDLTNATMDMLRESFNTLVEKRPEGIPEYVVEGIADRMAEQLEIEKPEEERDDIEDDDINDVRPDHEVIGIVDQSKKRLGVNLAQGKYWRKLTPAEGKVNFSGIQKKFDTLQDDWLSGIKPLFDKIRKEAVEAVTQLLEAKDYNLEGISLRHKAEYTAIITRQMLDAYIYAKNGAADEMGVKIPPNNPQSKEFIKQNAQALADKHFSDLLFLIKAEVTKELRKNTLSENTELGIGDVLSAIGLGFSAYFDKSISLAGTISIAQAVNKGRNDSFESNRKNISKYQYSAILDDRTCPICQDLDGTVTDYAGYRSTPWEPPIHENCRCIWVEILEDEEDQPDITGFPDEPGGIDEPRLSNNQQIEAKITELDSYAKELPEIKRQLEELNGPAA